MIDERTLETEEEISADRDYFDSDTELLKEKLFTLKKKNDELQNALHPLLFPLATNQAVAEENEPDQETMDLYTNSLVTFMTAQSTHESVMKQHNVAMKALEKEKQEKREKAETVFSQFSFFKKEISKSALHSKTKKPINLKLVSKLIKEGDDKTVSLQSLLLEHFILSSQKTKFEKELAAKDKIEEGLHLIDFEQLKMENQTLGEKIEGRQSEVEKLEGKTTQMVQILAHLNEKLKFTQEENKVLSQGTNLGKEVLNMQRHTLLTEKSQRDRLRETNAILSRETRFSSNAELLSDLQVLKEKANQKKHLALVLEEKLEAMQNQNSNFLTNESES